MFASFLSFHNIDQASLRFIYEYSLETVHKDKVFQIQYKKIQIINLSLKYHSFVN